MNTLSPGDLTFEGPAVYRIRILGSIPASWSDRVQGMIITVDAPSADPPVTTLVGELGDQASLIGVLDTLYGLRLPVLSVECLNGMAPDRAFQVVPESAVFTPAFRDNRFIGKEG